MSIRHRLALGAGLAVAIAVAAASLIAYFAVRAQLQGNVDDSLREQAVRVVREGPSALPPPGQFRRGDRFGGPQVYSQVVTPATPDIRPGAGRTRRSALAPRPRCVGCSFLPISPVRAASTEKRSYASPGRPTISSVARDVTMADRR